MKRNIRLLLTTISLVVVAACHATPNANMPASGNGGALGSSGSGSGGGGGTVGFAIQAEAPLALTASDGTGLRLAALDAKAVVDGPLAFTELHLTFDNPLDRTLEGTFRITLPQNASLGRFAMKIGGEWQEGEVVELEAARRAYEDFLHRKQDPALMEKSAGNEFSARVFPIPARGTKDIVVSWVEEIKDGKYVLPLKGLPELGTLDVGVKLLAQHGNGNGKSSEPPKMSAKNSAPASDYVVDLRAFEGERESKGKTSGVRNGELAIIRVRPQTTPKPEPLDSAIILVDTSASRVLGFESEVDLVTRIVKRIAEGNPSAAVTVACFDQGVSPIFDGRASGFDATAIKKMKERGALGASDLERALGWAHATAKKSHAKRVVLVTDGVATAGATDSKKLVPKVASLKDAGVERIDAVAIGGIRDDVGLTRIVRGNLAHDGIVADATRDQADVVRRLGEATRSNIAVKVDGATWAWPAKLDGAQAGDAYSIYAEVPANKDLKVSIDGGAFESVDPRKTERPLVERSIAQAKVSSMLEREITLKDPKEQASLKKSIVSIAMRNRIMTPYTAMLVLETESDYAQYGIDRKSLTDVLAIQDNNVRRIHRTDFVKLPLRPPQQQGPEKDGRDGYGYEFTDDPLAAGGFGPNDATIRVRPGPVATNPRGGDDKKRDEGGGALAQKNKPLGSSAPPPGAPPPPPPPPPARTQAAPRALEEAKPEAKALESAHSSSSGQGGGGSVAVRASPRPPPAPDLRRRAVNESPDEMESDDGGRGDDGPTREGKPAYEGKLATVMDMIKVKRFDEALGTARAWRAEAPGDVLALVALGEAAEAKEMTELAARAYGSVLDLFPNRADLRRFAGERLERLSMKDSTALDLAIDTFEKAVADRPDHPSSHRLLTFALVRQKAFSKAFDAAVAGAKRGYEVDRYAGVDRILKEDVGLVGAAWARAEPARRDEIMRRVREAGGRIEDQPSVRFILNWETDANDVDFHIHDARGGHAFFSRPHLRSGGDLYADVTTGYGPECFTIRGAKAKRAGPYKLEAHYYSRGPMGYGMGKLEVIDHDGNGNITFEERPFIVMVDQAFVELGTVK